MKQMEARKNLAVILLSILIIIQLTPVPARAWNLVDSTLTQVDFKTGSKPVLPLREADLDLDGVSEALLQEGSHVSIHKGEEKVWESPKEWEVVQSAITNLNQDGLPEVSLLIWRPFQPWPIDEYLPHGGRISEFKDGDGNSCHFILIGWIQDRYGELWAGSALAEPILSFQAGDFDNDLNQELVTLEGEYSRHRSSRAHMLKVWEWNGFGFSVVSSVESSFSYLTQVQTEDGTLLILTP